MDSLGEVYDFGSIMHYARNTFSRFVRTQTFTRSRSSVVNPPPGGFDPPLWLDPHPPAPRARCCPLLLRVLVFYLRHQFARVGHGGGPS